MKGGHLNLRCPPFTFNGFASCGARCYSTHSFPESIEPAGVRKIVRMLRRMRQPRRVVITGMGCVTPIGIGREAFWRALQLGTSGVRRIESFDVTDSPVQIAAEVQDFDWEAQLNPKDRKHVPRTVPL